MFENLNIKNGFFSFFILKVSNSFQTGPYSFVIAMYSIFFLPGFGSVAMYV